MLISLHHQNYSPPLYLPSPELADEIVIEYIVGIRIKTFSLDIVDVVLIIAWVQWVWPRICIKTFSLDVVDVALSIAWVQWVWPCQYDIPT